MLELPGIAVDASCFLLLFVTIAVDASAFTQSHTLSSSNCSLCLPSVCKGKPTVVTALVIILVIAAVAIVAAFAVGTVFVRYVSSVL